MLVCEQVINKTEATVIDLKVDGYYIIRPEHFSWDKVEFHPTTEEVGLDVIQKAVGGYIELVQLAEGGFRQEEGGPFGFTFVANGTMADLFLNEEGKLVGLPYNHLATELKNAMSYIDPADQLVGPVIILCGKAKEQPEQEGDD